jgi:YebC/PmpR family DNA-binding regulatory protein
MSGHNKWSTIKHKKAASDAKKGKAFSRVSKELTLATRLGGKDPSANARLRVAILAAKECNMPSDNVERAIKKGAGEIEGQEMLEITYEGFAVGGVAVIVDCLSDNRNRTAADVRSIFTKNNGKLDASGSVGRQFSRKSRFTVVGPEADEDKLMELFLEAGADVEDIKVADGQAEILGPPDAFSELMGILEKANIKAEESAIVRMAEVMAPVSEVSIARQVLRLLETLEENDDVQSVYANADIAEAVAEQLAQEE